MKRKRLLILGNSITRHLPLAEVDWHDDWGMAASFRDRDFAHLLVQKVAAATGVEPSSMIANIADYERNHAVDDIQQRFKTFVDFQAEIVVMAIGENVPKLDTEASQLAFKDSFARVKSLLTADSKPALIVRGCFGDDAVKDNIMCAVAQAAGGVFVSVARLAQREENLARSERTYTHGGVGGHPGDRGMAAIADAIFSALVRIHPLTPAGQ